MLHYFELESLPTIPSDEYQLVQKVILHFSETSTNLRRWLETYPQLGYLLCPVDEWLNAQEVPPLLSSRYPGPSSNDPTGTVINAFLITVQSFVSRCPELIPVVEEDIDQYILQDYRTVRDFTHLLNSDVIMKSLESVLLLSATAGEGVETDLQRILPFLGVYMELVKDQLVAHSQWTKALFKLNLVLCSILLTLSKEGFCQPPDAEEQEAGGDASETTDGVGLGEGSGTENVSKEIEDESQVEGLQGDDTEGQGPRDDQDDGDAIEMSEEIGGEMEDVPDPGSEDEAGSDHSSDVDPEERLENLDPSDPSAVDEKLWGDEKGPEDGKDSEKTNQDRSEEKSGESEVVAKEGKSGPKEKEAKKNEPREEESQDVQDEPAPENIEEEGEGPNADGLPMDDYVQDANTLDLPDDMDLGGDETEMGKEDLHEDLEADDEEPVDDKMDDTGLDQRDDDAPTDHWGQEDQPPEDIPEPMDQDGESEALAQVQEIDEDEDMNDESPEDGAGEDAVARPDVSLGDGITSSEEAHNLDRGESAATGQGGTTEGATGKDTAPNDKVEERDG